MLQDGKVVVVTLEKVINKMLVSGLVGKLIKCTYIHRQFQLLSGS